MTTDRGRGFTLMEVLLAAAITTILGLVLIALLRMAVANWRRAEDQRKAYASAHSVLGRLAEDLEAVAPPDLTGNVPSARLVCHYAPVDETFAIPSMRASPPRDSFGYLIGDGTDNDGNGPIVEEHLNNQDDDTDGLIDEHLAGKEFRQSLLLVRTIYGEDEDPALRAAGDGLDNDGDTRVDEELYNGLDDDGDGLTDEDLMATGGVMEVVYVLTSDGDRYSLRRGFRAPPSGAFSTAPPDRNSDGRPDWTLWPALAENVLHFAVTFMYSDGAGQERATGMWDSTRALYPYTSGVGPNEFREYVSTASLGDPTDDIFPRMARIALVLAPGEKAVKSTTLAQSVSANTFPDPLANVIEVRSTAGFTRPVWPIEDLPDMLRSDPQWPFAAHPGQYILVDNEWMLVAEVHDREKLPGEDRVASWFQVATDSFLAMRTPVRNTLRSSHEPVGMNGAPTLVLEGWTFSRDVFMTVHRERAFAR